MQLRLLSLLAVGIGLAGGTGQAEAAVNPAAEISGSLPAPTLIRSASGMPGPRYWEQRADYVIDLELDPTSGQVSGSQLVTYHNESPDAHRYIWLTLPPSTETSRAEVEAIVDATGQPLVSHRYGDSLRVDLPLPLESGEQFSFAVDFSAPTVPQPVASEDVPAQVFIGNEFYPRMVAYTDISGWQHAAPGMRDTTRDRGDYLVRITVPEDFVVAASGELANPRQILTSRQAAQLEQIQQTEDTVVIMPPRDRGAAPADTAKTWVFSATGLREFSFVASGSLVWEAFATGSGASAVRVMIYRMPGMKNSAAEIAALLPGILRQYAARTFDYPYPQMSIVIGDGETRSHSMLLLVNSGDMGAASIGALSANAFLPSFLDPATGRAAAVFLTRSLGSPDRRFRPDRLADGLTILRGHVLGNNRFDRAFADFARRWKSRRPHLADMARSLENASGVGLDWFWAGWLGSDGQPDVAIGDVVGDGGQIQVRLRNPGGIVMPVTLRLYYQDGSSRDVEVPVEWWLSAADDAELVVPEQGMVVAAELDPRHELPDTDRTNNLWPPRHSSEDEDDH